MGRARPLRNAWRPRWTVEACSLVKLVLICSTLALFAAAGCGGDDEDSAAMSSTPAATEATRLAGARRDRHQGQGRRLGLRQDPFRRLQAGDLPVRSREDAAQRVLRGLRRSVATGADQGRPGGRARRRRGEARHHRAQGRDRPGDLRRQPALLLARRPAGRGVLPERRRVRRPLARGPGEWRRL